LWSYATKGKSSVPKLKNEATKTWQPQPINQTITFTHIARDAAGGAMFVKTGTKMPTDKAIKTSENAHTHTHAHGHVTCAGPQQSGELVTSNMSYVVQTQN